MSASTAETTQGSGPAEFVIRRADVVGLGHIGHAFAVNLVEDSHQVSVHDRDPKRIAALTGARAAAQLADLAACDVVVTFLRDDDALAAVAFGPKGLVGVLASVGSTFPRAWSARQFPAASPMNMRAIVRIISPRWYSGVPMPAASLVHDHLVGMVARGWAGLDWSAVGLLAVVDVGPNDGRSRGTAGGACLPDQGGAARAS